MNGNPTVMAAVVSAVVSLVIAFLNTSYQQRQFEKKFAEDHDQFERKLEKEILDTKGLRRSELEQRLKDFRLKFYEKQMQVYADTCQSAARMAASRSAQDALPDWGKLNQLYMSDIPMVADPLVFAAVQEFLTAFSRMKLSNEVPTEIKSLAMQISEACRASLSSSFELPQTWGQLPAQSRAQTFGTLKQ